MAAYRLHRALLADGVDSRMIVDVKQSDDATVTGPGTPRAKLLARLRPHLETRLARVQKTDNPVLHSPGLAGAPLAPRLARAGADIAHLHWVAGGMVSLRQIARLRLPVVWTLHDMWPFCGSEHYATHDRWVAGYARDNRPEGHGGFDLDRWAWRRKRDLWRRPMQIVAPSRWLADAARRSSLMGGWPVHVIPNAIDTDTWSPVERPLARRLLGLPQERKLVLFGAMGGARDPRKGADLLLAALARLRDAGADLDLVIFGQPAPARAGEAGLPPGFPVHYLGPLHDEVALRLAYGAADCFVLPSRQDNLPNTGLEAQASGLPVVGFDVGGLPDIVAHEQTGYLAAPFEVEDLARGIGWVLEHEDRQRALSRAAVQHARATFAAPVVAGQYRALYDSCLSEARA